MNVDWEQIIGFVSLVGGFFWTLRNMLVMAKDGQTSLIGIVRELSDMIRGKPRN